LRLAERFIAGLEPELSRRSLRESVLVSHYARTPLRDD
jgi:hypothetical protein